MTDVCHESVLSARQSLPLAGVESSASPPSSFPPLPANAKLDTMPPSNIASDGYKPSSVVTTEAPLRNANVEQDGAGAESSAPCDQEILADARPSNQLGSDMSSLWLSEHWQDPSARAIAWQDPSVRALAWQDFADTGHDALLVQGSAVREQETRSRPQIRQGTRRGKAAATDVPLPPITAQPGNSKVFTPSVDMVVGHRRDQDLIVDIALEKCDDAASVPRSVEPLGEKRTSVSRRSAQHSASRSPRPSAPSLSTMRPPSAQARRNSAPQAQGWGRSLALPPAASIAPMMIRSISPSPSPSPSPVPTRSGSVSSTSGDSSLEVRPASPAEPSCRRSPRSKSGCPGRRGRTYLAAELGHS